MTRFILNGILLLLLMSSCTSDLEKGVRGWWTVDEINYKNEDMLHNILGNSIVFFDDHTCELPKTRVHSTIQVESKTGTWVIVKTDSSDYEINITADNEIFSGLHRIKFERNEQDRMLIMVLESESLQLRARKGQLHYQSNQELIKDLVNKTN